MRANQIQAAIDVPADQELLGPASLELDALRVPGSRRGAQIGLGGLGRPAGVGERVRESFPPRVGGG